MLTDKQKYHQAWYQTNKERIREQTKKRRQANPIRASQYKNKWRKSISGRISNKNSDLKAKYGITLDQYNRMLLDQNSQCAICHIKTKLHIDHDHATKRVRGLLCGLCNKSLGGFRDSVEICLNAVKYLQS
jgi:hypothetical protein